MNIWVLFDSVKPFLGVYPSDLGTCVPGDVHRNAHSIVIHKRFKLEAAQMLVMTILIIT